MVSDRLPAMRTTQGLDPGRHGQSDDVTARAQDSSYSEATWHKGITATFVASADVRDEEGKTHVLSYGLLLKFSYQRLRIGGL